MEQRQPRSSARPRREKITRISIVDQVCNSIKQDIADGVWKVGEKLPSEAEFADSFGVNRLSVRMALQKLSTLGIIRTQVGEGSFVCEFSLGAMLGEVSAFYEGVDKYRDIQQLRNLLEYDCMRRAVLSPNEEDHRLLEAALREYNACALSYNEDTESPAALERVAQADFDFHLAIIRLGHNRLYEDIYGMIRPVVLSHIRQRIIARTDRRRRAGLPPLGDDTHKKVYDCIIQADMEALQRANEEMLGFRPVEDTPQSVD